MTTRPVITPWDKMEAPPNAVEEAEDVGVEVLLLALSIMLLGVEPSMCQESQFSEF